MAKAKTAKAIITTLDSLEDLYALTSKPQAANVDRAEKLKSDEYVSGGNKNWFGVDGGYAEVKTILKSGWADGVTRMQECLSTLEVHNIEPVSIKRRKVRGDHGDDYDWQAGAQGEHDTAWTRSAHRNMKAPRTITLFCDIASGTSYRSASDSFYWRGAATLYLADHLQKAGFNVKIVASSAAMVQTATKRVYQFDLTVKDSNMPLDLNSLATTVCLAGFYRTEILSAYCAVEEEMLGGGHSNTRVPKHPDGAFVINSDSEQSARDLIGLIIHGIEKQA